MTMRGVESSKTLVIDIVVMHEQMIKIYLNNAKFRKLSLHSVKVHFI